MTLPVLQQDVSAAVTTGNVTLPSWTPATDELVLVGVYAPAGISPSLAGNGLTWASVGTISDTVAGYRVSVFRAMGASPTTGSITVTLTGNVAEADAIAVRISGALTGSNGADAVEDVQTAASAGGDADMLTTVTPTENDSLVIGFGGHGAAAFTVPGGETGIEINVQSLGTSIESAWYEAVATAAATQLGDTGDLDDSPTWALVALAVKPAPPAAAFVPSAVTPRAVARFFDPHTGRPLRDIAAWQ